MELAMQSTLGASGMSGYTPVWILTSRFGHRLSGAKTKRDPVDMTAEARRRTISDSVLQGSGFVRFQNGVMGVPAIACKPPSAGVFQQAFVLDSGSTDTSVLQKQLCVQLEFGGSVLQLTPPGNRNLVVAAACVRERRS